MRFETFCIMVALAIPVRAAAMTDLGRVGDVYPVVEPDVREEMQRNAVEHWEQINAQYQEQVRAYQPVDLPQLPRARADRTFLVDMRYTLDRDLKDRTGRVIYPRGYTFNPLDYMSLTLGLVVIDGGDPAQINWFRQSLYRENHRVKLLLSGGNAQELIAELHRPVFYLSHDLAERLQLAAVPCVVVQQGRQMLVTEFLIKEEKR